MIRNYRKKTTNPEDTRIISRLNQELDLAKNQNSMLIKEVDHLQNQLQHAAEQEVPRQSSNESTNEIVVKVHDKWISFSSDTILLAKKIVSFTESIVKTKAEKVQVDDFRRHIDEFENFLVMSREDLESLRMKNVG